LYYLYLLSIYSKVYKDLGIYSHITILVKIRKKRLDCRDRKGKMLMGLQPFGHLTSDMRSSLRILLSVSI
jgi:hypothetical protein